ncbi:MAG: hypothetical protein L0Y66_10950 [Myxococcaceae bacterium]|nr:hypothetical protein [Myxococcaceae bacterium]MCI0670083.1 hypothetical protein [Myxococcaceae bacterium]
MSGREAIRGSAYRLLFEAEQDGTRFFQVAVVHASGEWEAHALVEAFLARDGAQLIQVDPEETRPVDVPALPLAQYVDAELGVVEVSERLRVVTEHADSRSRGAVLH